MNRLVRIVGVVVVGGLLAQAAVATSAEQAATRSLGTVQVARQVLANGEAMAAGTYTLRVSDQAVAPVVGQTPTASCWVEFLQGGKVKGRELATVLTAAEVKALKKGAAPASGTARTDVLKGNDYLRIWVNRGGTNYIIHLALAPKS
jgi:hypothetical protein